ncbi:MAG: hypothetical protein ACK4QL_11875 [Pseudanabaenaceae cyanobacterium]
MESLMQKFAIARQYRQARRAELLAQWQKQQQQRAIDRQLQQSALQQVLTSANAQRLQKNQQRQMVADQHRQSRLQLVFKLAQHLDQQIANQQQARITRTIASRQARQEQKQTRHTTVREQLQQLRQQRLVQSQTARQQRQLDRLSRTTSIRQKLHQIKLNRASQAQQALNQRQQLRLHLQATVRAALLVNKSQRSQLAEHLRSALTSARLSLAERVGVISRPALAVPALPAQISPSTPEAFIQQYLREHPDYVNLKEVISDRDKVREILARGATVLRVDPSEILNTLLRMANNS